MSRFDVYRNPDATTRDRAPFLVEVQADLFTDLASCVVVPLSRSGVLTRAPLLYLTPTVEFEGRTYALLAPQLAGIVRADLGAPLGSLAGESAAIETAVWFLLRGF